MDMQKTFIALLCTGRVEIWVKAVSGLVCVDLLVIGCC